MPRSPKSWPAAGPALARDHRPFPARPEGGSRGVGAGVGANLRGSAARRGTPASCLSPRLRYAWSPALCLSSLSIPPPGPNGSAGLGAVANELGEPRPVWTSGAGSWGTPALGSRPRLPASVHLSSLSASCRLYWSTVMSKRLCPLLQPELISRTTCRRPPREDTGDPRPAFDPERQYPPLLWASVSSAIAWGQNPRELGMLEPVHCFPFPLGKDGAR